MLEYYAPAETDMSQKEHPEGFDEFNEDARRVLFYCRQAVADFGGMAITPEHLLLGLLQASPDVVGRFLGSPDSIDIVTQQVRAKVSTGRRVPTSVDLPLSAETERVLRKAVDEAGADLSSTVRPEHILLALLEYDDGPAIVSCERTE